METTALHHQLLSTPALQLEDVDLTDLLTQANQDDWVLLKLVACIAIATLLIALAVSVG
jgi:hypothetical protein